MKNKLIGLKKDMSDEKYSSIGVAINITILSKNFKIGDECGFTVGRRHFIIKRDNPIKEIKGR